MDINRDNYEEYFLLFADNELTDSEKVAVILFLKENKDLEEEFSMIHHTISKPEQNIILDDKSFLFKNNSLSLINDKNYEEIFVLYHDDELTNEYRNVMGRIDIITGTLGKALGGASGGFTTGKKEIIEMLRQRSRPYLFSNTVAPGIVGASIAVFDMLNKTTNLRDKLESNTKYFRTKMTEAGFDIKPGDHPIVPIMLYDAVLAQNFAASLLDERIYVIGFFFPVVAKGQARIRVQISAAHDEAQLDKAIAAFTKIGKKLGVLKN